MRNRIELLQGTLDLHHPADAALGPPAWLRHQPGHQRASSEALRVETGSLYPALHRLEQRGWVASALGHHRQ